MRNRTALTLSLAALALPGLAAAGPVVSTESGSVEGVEAGGKVALRIFRGVPFAAAPVGALRWREPQPVIPWTGTRKATEFAPRCMQQPLFSDMMFRSPPPSEDCLYLNVWTPANLARASAARLPVLVYIYGGGFMAGDGSEKRYDGAALAARSRCLLPVR